MGERGSHAVFCVTEEVLSAALAAIRHLDPRAGETDPSGSTSKNDLAAENLYRRFVTPGPGAKYRSQVPTVMKNNLRRDETPVVSRLYLLRIHFFFFPLPLTCLLIPVRSRGCGFILLHM